MFDLLGNISGLSLDDKFDGCEILAEKVEYLEIFMGLSDSIRPQYVTRLLKSKGTRSSDFYFSGETYCKLMYSNFVLL